MRPRHPWLALGLSLAALGLRLWELGRAPLWLDEAFTWQDAGQPLGLILGARVDVHPPLYYALIQLWIGLAGDSEWSLRLPSALLAVLTVPTAWALAGRLAPGHRAAPPLAAALVALSPVALAYAREARMYAVAFALGLLALATAQRVVDRPTGRRWAVHALVGLLAILTHYTALAAVGAAALRLLAAGRTVGWRAWLGVHALLLSVALGWGAHLWSNRDAWLGRVWHPWRAPTALGAAAVDWASALVGRPLGPVAPEAVAALAAAQIALGLGLAALGLATALRPRRTRPAGARPLALAVGLLALVPLVGFLAAELVRPSWNLRYTLVGLPAALLLVAVGATALPRSLGWPLLAALVLAQLPAVPAALRPEREDWPAVAAAIAREAGPDDVALGAVESIASYYLGRAVAVAQRPVALGRAPEEVVAELDARTRGRARVWLVPAQDPLLDPADLVGTTLARHADRRQDYDLARIRVTRLDLRPRERLALGPALRPLDATFGQAIRLVAYAAGRATAAGAPVADLSLDLRLERALPEDVKLFAHLLDDAGRTVAQRDVLVVDPAGRPTSQLAPGTRLRIELAIGGPPEQIARGRAVGVGLYQLAPPGARLPLAPPAPEHRLVLPLAD